MSGPGTPGGTPERPALFFADAAEWRAWLEQHHASEPELWMGLHKKHVADRGLTWKAAVVEALCFGWIDSVSQPLDDDSRRQRWSPRKASSNWSAVNLATVERLIEQGRMHPAGLAAYEARSPERERVYTYEKAPQTLPPEADALLRSDPAASAFWDAATPGYRRIATGWVLGAKRAETRERRLAALVEDCAAGRLIPSQRYGVEPAWVRRALAASAEARTLSDT
ncbi:YdeI/OmpD-associated family protein [Luteipulveratus halotolerans]|uniref:Bacteriocin-protection protein, YdeI/OmpD-associated family n=1 Tax=Luteipulveratus halotolerans TaxID=1631356 RepID=A0A0L6CKT3_9MICO|nr:YdeI/OmpD-associated family protein [Luteipulveratus halotolerans]KNX38367.1 hypothetical protein VV01_16380 [Luteipulveratus halotolerans]